MIFRFFVCFITLGFIFAQNNFPIVLIHGFMGWGPEEMGSYNYWGGENDYVRKMKEKGYNVIELSVGPVSSNWERAVEAYYQLKGGQVDYGMRHSKKFNIIQKPKDSYYSGLYPEWDSNHPIHIVAHSMGGQTARMLNYLLMNEIYIDDNSLIKEESSLLGDTHNKMIKSITAISSPHDGTTLRDVVVKAIPFVQYFVGVAGVIGTNFYDFDLDHFQFTRDENESWSSYLSRMRNHNAWETKNICSWDLSLDGAKTLNAILKASPDIYYFSIVTSTTKKRENSQYHDPVDGTSILIKTRSKLLGARSGYWLDGSKTDSSWYENDGVVNTVSMYGPQVARNEPDPIVPYKEGEMLIPGQWYWIKILEMDHWSIIGHLGSSERKLKAEEILFKHLERLKELPPK